MRSFISVKKVCGVTIGLFCLLTECTYAQIVPDNSLGTESSELVPRAAGGIQIEGGAVRGESLFHSFTEFGISAGEVVYFANPAAIETILGRVTGDVRSDILGTLGVDGPANLYLINPNGIVFGPDAQLDIGGSFFVSTAPSLNLGNGTEFSAIAPTSVPLLTISVTPGLQLGQDLTGAIVSSAETLGVGDRLTLAAGTMELRGGQIEVGDHLDILAHQLLIRDGARIISVNSGEVDGGGINIRAIESVELRGFVQAGDTGSPDPQTPPSIDREDLAEIPSLPESSPPGGVSPVPPPIAPPEDTDSVPSTNTTPGRLYSSIQTVAQTTGSGDAGNLVIETSRLVLEDGTEISSSTFGAGRGGDVTIRASDSVAMRSPNLAFRTNSVENIVLLDATGDAGNLLIETNRLVLEGNAEITGSTFGDGQGSNVTIRAAESVELRGSNQAGEGSSQIIANSVSRGANAGDLSIETERLLIEDGALVSSSTLTDSDGGDLTIYARDSVELRGQNQTGEPSLILTDSRPGATGNAGDLSIETERLVLEDGARVSSTTFNGNGGNLTIRAHDSIELRGQTQADNPSRILTEVQPEIQSTFSFQLDEPGNAGDLSIETRRLVLEDGAQISSSTFGNGDGGNLAIRALESVDLRGRTPGDLPSLILTEVRPNATGRAGNLTVETGQLSLEDGAVISTSLLGIGRAGSLRIQANEQVAIFDDSMLEAITTGGGPVGNLELTTPQLTVQDSGQLVVSSEGDFPAGTLSLNAEQIQLNDRASLRAETESGDEGSIRLNARGILLRDDSSITTSATNTATGGSIDISSETFFLLSDRSRVEARATAGQGGDINIATRLFLRGDNSVIDASSTLGGIDGTVDLDVVETSLPAEPEVSLPSFTRAEPDQRCEPSQGEPERSRFIRTGRGGLPVDANAISSSGLWEDMRLSELGTRTPQFSGPILSPQEVGAMQSSGPALEAQGWSRTESGMVMLTAEPAVVTPYSASRTPANCQTG